MTAGKSLFVSGGVPFDKSIYKGGGSMKRNVIGWAAIVLMISPVRIAKGAPPPELGALTFLVGEWEASGQGQPGAASGRTVFSRSLQERVIVRTSYAEYPASGDKPASRHDDLMVVYAAADGVVRADYYDNEGHTIRYSVTSPAAGQAVFVSELVAGEPRYRLSYELEPSGLLKGEFAIAAPGATDDFKVYLSWESRKTTSPSR
jgi:hypothetical protein